MVKKVKSLVVIFCLLLVSLQAQTQYFHYFKGEKRYWTVSPNKAVVHFADTNAMKTSSISSVSKTGCKELYMVHFSESDTAQTRGLLMQWKNRSEVLYSGPVFIDEYGEEIAALTNQIVVHLKQETDYSILLASLKPYQIDTIRQYEFDAKTY